MPPTGIRWDNDAWEYQVVRRVLLGGIDGSRTEAEDQAQSLKIKRGPAC